MTAFKIDFLGFLINSLIVYAALTLLVFAIEYSWRNLKARMLHRLLSWSYILGFLLLILPLPLWKEAMVNVEGDRGVWLNLSFMDEAILPGASEVLIDFLIISYIVGILFLLARDVFQYIWLRKRFFGLPTLDDLPPELKGRAVMVYISEGIEVFSFGLLRKRIIIPKTLEGEQRTSVLYHEYSHMKDQDFLFHMIERLIKHVLFLNPLAWVLKTKIDFYRECKADEFVIGQGIDPIQYSEQLVSMAEATRNNRVRLFFKSRSSMVLKRLKNLLDGPRHSPRLSTIVTSITLLILSLSTVSLFSKDLSTKVAGSIINSRDWPEQERGTALTEFDKKANALKADLLKDGLVDGKSSYKIEFRRSGLYINGKKQPDSMYNKYVPKVNDLLGKDFAPGGIIYLSQKDYE